MQAIFGGSGGYMAQLAQILRFGALFSAFAGGMLWVQAAHADDLRAKPAKARATVVAGEALAKPIPTQIRPGLAGSFLSGRFAKQNQDLTQAARYLSETLAHDPSNEDLQREAMRMYVLAGDVASAISLAHQLEKSKNNEPLVASLLMLEHVKKNDFAAAQAAINSASSEGLFGLIRPVMNEWLMVAAGEKIGIVDMQSTIDKAGFFAPFINYHTALMNDVLGNKAAAQDAYAKANIDAAVTPYRVIEAVANFQARQGKWEDAQATYDAYAAANPQSSLIPEKLTAGTSLAPLVADAKQGLAELFFTTASILFGEDSTQDTFLYLRIALDLNPNLPPAQLMLANLYEQVADYTQAIATYDKIPEGSVFSRRAQIRKALNYEALGQKEKAIALLESIASRYPSDASALITKGDMEREANKFILASETYSAAISRTEPLGASDWPLLYARGISYERSGNWNLAEADFMRALKLQPDQPDVLNYLAYSWLTMNTNLVQAREYLELASAQRPDDAHIIDSVGWAHYLNGNFKAAVEQFERAIAMMPDDPTVNDHLGDAYWRVGREVEARYQWERALSNKPDKDLTQALQEKLANGMPAFVRASKPEVSAKAPQIQALDTPSSAPITQVQ